MSAAMASIGNYSFFLLTIVVILLSFRDCYSYIIDPGPVVKATKGGVWPIPQLQEKFNGYYVFRSNKFTFKLLDEKNTCKILQAALDRYKKIIHTSPSYYRDNDVEDFDLKIRPISYKNSLGHLSELFIKIETKCNDKEFPDENMNEEYALKIGKGFEDNSILISKTVWGAIRGLETFAQLIYFAEDINQYIINATVISDYPRFAHRGLLLDTSRHFIPVSNILQLLDGIVYNKMNVFHWHIVDDHSFPYQSLQFPTLSGKGAYHKTKVYSQSDVRSIVEYGRIRGIRVMPEFDTPGHTRSWGEGIKGILTECYSQSGKPTGKFGPMDPSKPYLYKFLTSLYEEIITVFPERYIHLGGDEVEFECWESNPNITEYMNSLNITGDYKALESDFIQKLLKIVDTFDVQPVVWEEVFVNGVKLSNKTVVHVWKNDGYDVLNQVTKAGKPALLSSCWYLDHLETGGDWKKFYNCDPYDMSPDARNNDAQLALLLGGEACMWAEVVNEYNVASRVWPRASATAEKLWSQYRADTAANAAHRLEEHVCRLNKRGIPAQPANGPGFCV